MYLVYGVLNIMNSYNSTTRTRKSSFDLFSIKLYIFEINLILQIHRYLLLIFYI